jgi:hypothetical protein
VSQPGRSCKRSIIQEKRTSPEEEKIMGLLIAECLPDETAIDRTNLWFVERDDEIVALRKIWEPFDDDVPLGDWDREVWDREWADPPMTDWVEMRLGALRQLFTDEDEGE